MNDVRKAVSYYWVLRYRESSKLLDKKDKYRHNLEGAESWQDTEAISQRVLEAVKRMKNQRRVAEEDVA